MNSAFTTDFNRPPKIRKFAISDKKKVRFEVVKRFLKLASTAERKQHPL
jgi:hypothetical protein